MLKATFLKFFPECDPLDLKVCGADREVIGELFALCCCDEPISSIGHVLARCTLNSLERLRASERSFLRRSFRRRLLSILHMMEEEDEHGSEHLALIIQSLKEGALSLRLIAQEAKRWCRPVRAERRRQEQEIEERRSLTEPSPDAPDTLGWRGWIWDGSVLISPTQRTAWHDITLRAEQWAKSTVLRGKPAFTLAGCRATGAGPILTVTEIGRCDVHGIVERFGRYVLGTEGWRAEWVVIRELMAPDAATALALMRKYPDVRVHVQEQEACNEDR